MLSLCRVKLVELIPVHRHTMVFYIILYSFGNIMILALVHVDSRIPLGLVVDSFPLTGSMIFKVLRFSLVCFFKTNYRLMQVRRIE